MTARQAKTSLPSTRRPGKPKPRARWYSGILVCRSSGSEIAHWLFWQKKTTGALATEAQMNASFTSPWLVAPSPKYAIAASPSSPTAPSRWIPIA